MIKYGELTAKIIDCAYKVKKKLDFGFLESVYQNALVIELSNAGLQAEKEKKFRSIMMDRSLAISLQTFSLSIKSSLNYNKSSRFI